jgi:hypothetical protein
MSDKTCAFCESKITNKNKEFCNRICQIEYMKRRECFICGKNYLPEESEYSGVCSSKCNETDRLHDSKRNLSCFLNIPFDFDIMSVEVKAKSLGTGKIEKLFYNFEEAKKCT